jgi:hypothetical protein
MTGGAGQRGRVDAHVLRPQPIDAFGIYRQRGEGELAHFLGTAATMKDAQAKASLSLQHKDTLLIYENDERTRRKVLHVFKVRQGAVQWRRNAETGLSERWHPLKLDPLFSLPVDEFAPKRPFDAFRDDPVGVDCGLVEATEGRAAA